MKFMKYKGFTIEWIPHREAFRIYRDEKPWETIAYEDTLQDAMTGIDDNAWRWEK